MSEFQMESARAVNSANRQESALHEEIYSPTSQWASFEKLNAQSNAESPSPTSKWEAFERLKAQSSEEIHSPTSKWADFERLNAQSNRERNPIYLDMNTSDLYKMECK